MRYLTILLLSVSLPAVARAQTAGPVTTPRAVAVTAGVGNAMGILGVQGERYLPGDRLSVFGGVGYLPKGDPGDASGVALAGGMRAFTSGARHRGFVEVSVSHLAHDLACFDDCHHYYGPGVQGGYQFVARRGLTVMASLGVGYGPSIPDGEDNVGALIGVGFGYTWRR